MVHRAFGNATGSRGSGNGPNFKQVGLPPCFQGLGYDIILCTLIRFSLLPHSGRRTARVAVPVCNRRMVPMLRASLLASVLCLLALSASLAAVPGLQPVQTLAGRGLFHARGDRVGEHDGGVLAQARLGLHPVAALTVAVESPAGLVRRLGRLGPVDGRRLQRKQRLRFGETLCLGVELSATAVRNDHQRRFLSGLGHHYPLFLLGQLPCSARPARPAIETST